MARTGAYDVVNISPWWIGDFGPFLEPIEKYVNDPKVAQPDFDYKDYNPDVLKAYCSFEGKTIGLPYRADHMMLVYRTDLLEDPKEKDAFKAKYGAELVPPKTWDEHDKIAEFFTRPDKSLWGSAVMGKRSHQSGAQWINRFFSFGGQYFDAKGVPTINSEAGVKAMGHLVNTGKKFGAPGYLTHESAEARQMFWEGKYALSEAWPGGTVVGAQDPKQSKVVGKVNGVVMPGGGIGCGGGWFLAMSADSKNKVAAFKWLELLATKKYVKRAFELQGEMPGRLSPYKETYVQSTLPKGFAEQFATAFTKSLPPPNRYPEDSELKSELDRYVSEAMSGIKPPKQAMDEAQQSWVDVLKRAGTI
ncbi:MAG: extracellular solute-binding protein [Chloroflexota bacterium]